MPDLPRHQRPAPKLRRFLFGAPYYPEHWTDADRADDPRRMAEAGVNVVRMAEFAWHRIEPARGRFDWTLFDETIDRLGAAGIDTILCTPTAAPPRWLTDGHDELLRVDEAGRRMDHGTRQHCCTTNEAFRAESRRITQAMAGHYAANPHVIGWQTDNELNCHFNECYCPACLAGYRASLQRRYGTIEALNEAWGTDFWALRFDGFEQVPLPYVHGRPAFPNPTAVLDYYRFLGESVREFQRQQVEILHAANPRWFVTHNGMFTHVDYWAFAGDLDFLSVDIYPGFWVRAETDAARTAEHLQRCRAATGGFIVPEQQAGPGGQRPYIHLTPPPGRMRLWAWQSVAHGADGVLHFRWRTCRFGAEEYWCGVLDHDNVPRRRYEEFAREGDELKRLGPKLLGTVQDVRAAVLVEDEQDEAHQTMSLSLPSPGDVRGALFAELWKRHLPAGLVHTADRFDGLRLLVLPSMPLMDEALAGKLRQFVEGGGVLVVTARSATRDRHNRVIPATPPGLLAELCGVTVEEFGRLEPGTLSLRLDGADAPAAGGYEVLALRGAVAAATWALPDPAACGAPHAAAGQPAVAVHKVRAGVAIYVGTYADAANAAALTDLALHYAAGLTPLADAPAGVEVTRRGGGGRRLTFVLNHYARPQTVRGLPAGNELLAGRPCRGTLELEPYGVAVVEES